MRNSVVVPAREAVARIKNNPGAAWPDRRQANRVEPECWPEIHPGFRIRPGARVFTIGSCFARNIAEHLALMGFDVPSVSVVKRKPELFANNGVELLHKYTPTSILQELGWTRRIRDRDDTVRADDVMPLLLDLGRDRYIDMHTRADPGYGFSLEEQLERRRLIYELNRTAFDCDLAVVTLGHIETWWDASSGQAVEFHGKMLRLHDGDRFGFRRLDYQEAYDATEQSVRLILADPRVKMLITTSPIPIARTFSGTDVVVANTYSKSMLRTVAGAIVERFEGVDYFPSFESVMLTRKPEIWSNDLVHVEAPFIGRIMARVVSHYVEQDEDAAHRAGVVRYAAIAKFAELVAAGDWDGARPVYAEVKAAGAAGASHRLFMDLAEYELAHGLVAEVRAHMAAAQDEDNAAGQIGPDEYLRCARIFAQLGDEAGADRARAAALASMSGNPVRMRWCIVQSRNLGGAALLDAEWLMQQAERLYGDNAFVLDFLARIRREDGRRADYERLRHAALALTTDAQAHLQFAAELATGGRLEESLSVLAAFDERESHPVVFRRLANVLFKEKRLEEAEAVIRRRLRHASEDPIALGMMAQLKARCGARQEALVLARRAIALGNDAPGLATLVERLDDGGS